MGGHGEKAATPKRAFPGNQLCWQPDRALPASRTRLCVSPQSVLSGYGSPKRLRRVLWQDRLSPKKEIPKQASLDMLQC